MEGKQDNIRMFAQQLNHSIVSGNYKEFSELIHGHKIENIKRIADYPFEACPSLIVACEHKRTDMIDELLEHCHADVSCKGTVNIQDHEIEVNPLWLSVRVDDIKIANLLIKHGARVNDSCWGSTPLQEACYIGSEEMVKLLVSNGADVHVQNQFGSCLRDVIDTPSILQYLLSNGANPNLFQKRSYPVIHLAIEGKYNDSVKILMNHGCDWTLKDFDGNDAIIFAALSCNVTALEFLLEKCNVSNLQRYEAYELLGSAYVSVEEKYECAVNCWKAALDIKNREKVNYKSKCADDTLVLSLLRNYREPVTNDEFDAMRRSEERLVERSLVVRDKILGSTHAESIQRLSIYGMEMAVDGDRKRAFEILSYVYRCILQRYGQLDRRSVHMFTYMAQIYGDMLDDADYDNDEEAIPGPLRFLLLRVIEELQYGCSLKRKDQELFNERYAVTYVKLMELFIDCIFILIESTEMKIPEEISSKLSVLIAMKPEGMAQNSLLHFALCRHPKPKIHAHLFKIKHWHYSISEVLLRYGADVNARNIDGETPVHVYLRHVCTTKISEDIALLLLRYDAHIDICDKEGRKITTSAKKVGINFDEARWTTLKCLASRIVLKYNINYNKSLVPQYLVDFIDMHKL